MMKFFTSAIVALLSLPFSASAQQADDPVLVDRKFYSANALDGAIFSTALMERPGSNTQLNTLRFSMINIGINLHYDFNSSFGLYTGAGIKNIGFIEKFKANDSTVKRRIYSLDVPLGIKIGNLKKRSFFFLGGGGDLALNYREKGFIKRGDKEKFNEWFSDRTPLIMPFLFAGYSVDPGLTIKLQYYPQSFINSDYTELHPVTGQSYKPYSGYKVNLLLLSLGIDIHYNVLPRELRPKKK